MDFFFLFYLWVLLWLWYLFSCICVLVFNKPGDSFAHEVPAGASPAGILMMCNHLFKPYYVALWLRAGPNCCNPALHINPLCVWCEGMNTHTHICTWISWGRTERHMLYLNSEIGKHRTSSECTVPCQRGGHCARLLQGGGRKVITASIQEHKTHLIQCFPWGPGSPLSNSFFFHDCLTELDSLPSSRMKSVGLAVTDWAAHYSETYAFIQLAGGNAPL